MTEARRQMSDVSAASGRRSGQSNRKRNFGNVGRATVPAGFGPSCTPNVAARWPTLLYLNGVSYKMSSVGLQVQRRNNEKLNGLEQTLGRKIAVSTDNQALNIKNLKY